MYLRENKLQYIIEISQLLLQTWNDEKFSSWQLHLVRSLSCHCFLTRCSSPLSTKDQGLEHLVKHWQDKFLTSNLSGREPFTISNCYICLCTWCKCSCHNIQSKISPAFKHALQWLICEHSDLRGRVVLSPFLTKRRCVTLMHLLWFSATHVYMYVTSDDNTALFVHYKPSYYTMLCALYICTCGND